MNTGQIYKIRQYSGYIAIVVSYVVINLLILHKWITVEYDNNYAGGLTIPFLGISNFILNIVFFISYLIAGIANRKRRFLYLMTAFFAFIPIGILIITG